MKKILVLSLCAILLTGCDTTTNRNMGLGFGFGAVINAATVIG